MIDYKILVEKAQAGDTDAFGTIYNELYSPVFKYAYVRTRDKEHSEDIAGEVFLKFFSSLSSYSSQKETPLNYLFTITRNLLINSGKKKKADLFDEGMEEMVKDETPDQLHQSMHTEETAYILSKLSLIQDDQREVIELKFLSELSTKEVADILSKTEANVRQLESRGLRQLRELCSQEIHE